jgi:hypothetical protein
MLRVMGLALLLVVGAAVPAAADDAGGGRESLAGASDRTWPPRRSGPPRERR